MSLLPKRLAQRYLQEVLKQAGGSRTLYHIGNRPGEPKPKKLRQWDEGARGGEAWTRPWLDKPVKSGVFLTDDPLQVAMNHGVRGNVYAYEVPNWVIKDSGGVHRYDSARELLVPKDLWKHIKFKGKAMGQKELDNRVKRKFQEVFTKELEQEMNAPLSGPKKEPPKPHTKREQKQFEQWASKRRYPNPLPRDRSYEDRITFRTLKQHAQSEDPGVRRDAQRQVDALRALWNQARTP